MSNKLQIPDFYKKELEDNSALNGLVLTTFGGFEAWLGLNRMKFFDGYTDHSIEHINSVMDTSVKLIRDECKAYLKERDAAVFLIACLLHDCAMHLSKDGFIDLVSGNYKNNYVDGFEDKGWEELWNDFIIESRRFSSRKLISIFGDPEPVDPPDFSKNNFTDKEYLLVGEFLRRHHHRLAHEIALFGVPGPHADKLCIKAEGDYDYLPDLAGLVARSHGMDMRKCAEYLRKKYNSTKEQRKVHTVYLMALLRISDILQIEYERAPKELDKLRKLESPISKLEWETHQCIKDINFTEKPETITIDAKPGRNKIYLKVKDLLKNIQGEFDKTWVIIGETYGFDNSLKEFGLKYRRIESNLDDKEKFSETVDYLPAKASFEAADSDLLKLLIEPLYGDIPGVGVRELLQNSLDAVRELKEYSKTNKVDEKDFPVLEGDIVMSINKDENSDDYWFTIEDKGIGMNFEVVSQYFLKAGASFRRSDLWRRNFEDDEGKSKILRSGRFGIGVLAAYLLGDEIFVSTRYVNDKNGIEFKTKLEEESIEFKKTNRKIGTTIKILLTKKVVYELVDSETEKGRDNWDWYCLNDIKVIRKIDDKDLKQRFLLPESNSELSPGWYRIEDDKYQDIHWNYYIDKSPSLACNGITVNHEDFIDFFKVEKKLSAAENFQVPNLSIFDPNSNLPLTLQRDRLPSHNIPFLTELCQNIFLDYFAFLLVSIPNKYNFNWFRNDNYPGTYKTLSQWIFWEEGITLSFDKNLCIHRGKSRLITIFIDRNRLVPKINEFEKKYDGKKYVTVSYYSENDLMNNLDLLYELSDMQSMYSSHRILFNKKNYDMSIKSFENFYNAKYHSNVKQFIAKLKLEYENKYWLIFTLGNCPPDNIFKKYADRKKYNFQMGLWPGIVVMSYNPIPDKVEKSQFAELWESYMGDPVIPYDMKERKKKFAEAYIKLDKYIKVHEAFKETNKK